MAVSEWDQRQLCSDGGCVGVIGPEGTCKVCGRAAPNWGDERKRGLIEPEEHDEEEDDDELEGEGEGEGEEEEEEEEEEAEDEDGAAAATSRSEWTTRRLCPDGSCIGVIDESGRCKVCGRAAPDVPANPPAAEAETVAGDPASPSGDPGVAGAGPAGERERCPDTGCSGTIGTGGRCEVCGKGAS